MIQSHTVLGSGSSHETGLSPESLAAIPELSDYRVQRPQVGLDAVAKFLASVAASPDGKTKQQTFADALDEQRLLGTVLEGFEGDEDFKGTLEKVVAVFGQDTFDRCLVEKIVYDQGKMLLKDRGNHFEIPVETYRRLKDGRPEVEKYRVLAYSTASLNSSPAAKRYQRLPIALYSFDGESLDTKEYLPDELSEEKKMRVYKLGTVVHEFAHSVRNYQVDNDVWQEWQRFMIDAPPLTEYAAAYVYKHNYAEEQFAEAVRIFATNSQYLRGKSPELAQFLESKLPNLSADSLISP